MSGLLQALLSTLGISNSITLSGIDGTPNLAVHVVVDPLDAEVAWEFRTDGEVWITQFGGTDSQFQTGIEWDSKQPTPDTDYWIKATQIGVTSPGVATDVGTPLDAWYKLAGAGSSHRSYGWVQASVGDKTGTVKVEISTDDSGVTIVATGYYKGTPEVTL